MKKLHRMMLKVIDLKIDKLTGKVESMALTQEQFDQDLADLVSAIGNLVSAMDVWVAAHPDVDLTAEDSAVKEAVAQVQTELDKLTPAAPEA